MTAQGPHQLESEGTAADDEPGGQGEVEPEGVLPGQADRALAGRSGTGRANWRHLCHPTGAGPHLFIERAGLVEVFPLCQR